MAQVNPTPDVGPEIIAYAEGMPVWVRYGSSLRQAIVVELRGPLGPGGERVLRVRLVGNEDPPIEFDAPASWLQISPMREYQRQRARRQSSEPTTDLWPPTQPDEVPVATTHVVDDERLTKQALESMAESIGRSHIPLNIEHVPGVNPIGWVTAARVVRLSDGEFGLVGKASFLTPEDFQPPDVLTPPAKVAADIPNSSPVTPRLIAQFDERQFDSHEIDDARDAVKPYVDLQVRPGERRYSADPVAVIALTILAYPFLSRLAERLSDDIYNKVKSGVQRLAHLKPRGQPRHGSFLVVDYPQRPGPVELVVEQGARATNEFPVEAIDAGIRIGKGLLAANSQLTKVCMNWNWTRNDWSFGYAITKDYKVIAASPLIGERKEDGVAVRSISVPPGAEGGE